MKKLNLKATLILTTLFMGGALYSSAQNSFQSANVLEFGSDNILFVGDSKSGKIHAFKTETVENKKLFLLGCK